MEIDGYQVTKVVGPGLSGEDFAVVIENRSGERKAIVLAEPFLSQMSDLLNQARSARDLSWPADDPQHQSVTIDATTDMVAVARIEVRQPVDLSSPSTSGIFEIRLEDADGHGVTLKMPHESAVDWAKTLTQLTGRFAAKHSN